MLHWSMVDQMASSKLLVASIKVAHCPLLYLIVVESLKKLQTLQNNGELKGLRIARGVKNANHAQFTDDTILLVGASVIIVERFREVISIFLKASDGKVNALKTKIYGWNCPKRTMVRIAKTLGN